MTYPLTEALPATLTIIRYPDPVVETFGYGPETAYPEYVWLSIIGPSSLLMWRRLARTAAQADSTPTTIETQELFHALGLGAGLNKNSPGARTIARLLQFDLARRVGASGQLLAVRTALPRVPEHRLARLPASAIRFHNDTPAGPASAGTGIAPGRRAAAGLFRLGKLHTTTGAIDAMAKTGTDPGTLIARHHRGDWGDVDIDEALANNDAITTGAVIHSIYNLEPTRTGPAVADTERIVWVITETGRTATTITTPQEY